jgi:hypothetical protein
MEFLLVLLILGLIVGLITRSKGDGLLDTIGSGCSTIFILVVLLLIILLLIAMNT